MNKKIMIAIPAVDGRISHELAIRLITWSHDDSVPVRIIIEAYSTPVDHARNVIVQRFVNSDCTHLLMIDDDTIPPIRTVAQLSAHDKDIVGALVPILTREGSNLVTRHNVYAISGEGYEPLKFGSGTSGLVAVDAIGTGCIMVSKTVLLAFLNGKNPQAPFKTEYETNGIKYRSEDIAFCRTAIGMGFKVYCDHGIKCKHIKNINLLEL